MSYYTIDDSQVEIHRKTPISEYMLEVKDLEVSASHFIHTTAPDSKCQCLHGHNYYVTVFIHTKELPENGMVIDVSDVKRIVDELDHKTLLPKSLMRKTLPDYVWVRVPRDVGLSQDYIFPKRVCVVLDLPCISAEYMAQYYANKILECSESIEKVVVGVSETKKMIAWYTATKV